MERRSKVIRSDEKKQKQENTQKKLLAMRVLIIFVIIAFICLAAFLFAKDFLIDTEILLNSDADSDTVSGYYQRFDEEQSERLIEYCNNSVSISKYYTVELSDYCGFQVSSLMKESLEKMVDAAKADGVNIQIVRGYMSYDECKQEYKRLQTQFEAEGYTLAESESRARAVFPTGGNNEYQTGMLIKVSNMDSADFEKTDEFAWLYKNGINYGFINRYTEEKMTYTGINEDMTVFRFVGTENSQKMRSFGMCLEEYADYCSYH